MKQSKSVMLVLLVLVAAPLMLLCGTVSAQGYGESSYGGRTYDNWQDEDRDHNDGAGHGQPEGAAQSPGIVIAPEPETNDGSDKLQIDSPITGDDAEAIDEVGSTERPGVENVGGQDSGQSSSLVIWLSIGAIVLALSLLLFALLRRRRGDSDDY